MAARRHLLHRYTNYYDLIATPDFTGLRKHIVRYYSGLRIESDCPVRLFYSITRRVRGKGLRMSDEEFARILRDFQGLPYTGVVEDVAEIFDAAQSLGLHDVGSNAVMELLLCIASSSGSTADRAAAVSSRLEAMHLMGAPLSTAAYNVPLEILTEATEGSEALLRTAALYVNALRDAGCQMDANTVRCMHSVAVRCGRGAALVAEIQQFVLKMQTPNTLKAEETSVAAALKCPHYFYEVGVLLSDAQALAWLALLEKCSVVLEPEHGALRIRDDIDSMTRTHIFLGVVDHLDKASSEEVHDCFPKDYFLQAFNMLVKMDNVRGKDMVDFYDTLVNRVRTVPPGVKRAVVAELKRAAEDEDDTVHQRRWFAMKHRELTSN